MPIPDVLPAAVVSVADAVAVDTAGRRVLTPCGEGGSIVWRTWGEGDPVLLLHGGSGSWNHWVRNIAALVGAGRSVWAADMPGFGASASAPGGEDADVLPHWIERGLDALIGAAPCDVVGFSFGALVAAFLATSHPGRVRRLVLVGAPALSAEIPPPIDLHPWQHLPEGLPRDVVHRHNLRALMLAHDASVDDLAIALHSVNVARDRMRKRRLMLTDALSRMLPTLACPLAGIWGAEDALYRDRLALIERTLSLSSGFRSVALLPQAGHWVQYERAVAFDAELGRVLA